MRLHCPHCQNRFERSHLHADESIACPRCDKSFELSSKDTILYVSQGEEHSPGSEPEPPLPFLSLSSGQQLGGFVLENKIGEGGMGIVYRAQQLSLSKPVAVKILPAHLSENPEFVQRFNREAQALAALSHPNIVSIIDKGLDRGHYYFAMELIDGVNLRTFMDQSPLEIDPILSIVQQICSALDYAHDQGLVHRDIKPENILIDREQRLKLADFGLSKIVHGETAILPITRSHVTVGTVEYMAPEQRHRSRDVDHQADIFSLGVILYEMLTGELPLGRFEGPSTFAPLPQAIDSVVLKCLDQDPSLRYQKAGDVYKELQQVSHEKFTDRSKPGKTSRNRSSDRGWTSWISRHSTGLIVTISFLALAPPLLPLWIFIWSISAAIQRVRNRPPRSPSTPASPETEKNTKTLPLAYMALALSLVLGGLSILIGLWESIIYEIFIELDSQQMMRSLLFIAFASIPGIGLVLMSSSAIRHAKATQRPGRWIGRMAFFIGLAYLAQLSALWTEMRDEFDHWTRVETQLKQDINASLRYLEEIQKNPHSRRAPRLTRQLVAVDPTTAPTLLEADLPADARVAVIRGLAGSSDPLALSLLETSDPTSWPESVRIAWLESLHRLPAERAISQIQSILKSLQTNAEFQATTLQLAALHNRSTRAQTVMIEILRTRDLRFAHLVGESLLQLEGATIVQAWADMAQENRLDLSLRKRTMFALAQRSDWESLQALVALLEDPDAVIRASALAALETLYGTRLGFQPSLSPDVDSNRNALKQWQERIEQKRSRQN
jgi:serine/threonine protein kinase